MDKGTRESPHDADLDTRWRQYRLATYQSEAALEDAIIQVQEMLFGTQRIYLPIKKNRRKGGVQNVPDGYLIDLTGKQPRLYVVENELAAHDPLRHIAVQILQFSLSFESEGLGVEIFTALQDYPEFRSKCETYATANQFRNLDHLLEHFSSPAQEIGPIPLVKGGRVKPLYNLRYATRAAWRRQKHWTKFGEVCTGWTSVRLRGGERPRS